MNTDGNLTSIIIALVGLNTILITTLGGSLVWTIKWFAKHYGGDMRAHTNAANTQAAANKKLAVAVERNTASNQEVLTFMQSLNGKLAKATAQTIKEQNVEHQHIEISETKKKEK